MAFARSTFIGDGATGTFAITWPFLSRQHVKVEVNGLNLLPTEFSFVNDSTIKLKNVPQQDDVVVIFRETSPANRLVDYAAGAQLSEKDLDTDSLQAFYLHQEAQDIFDDFVNRALQRVAEGAGLDVTDASEILDQIANEVINSDLANELQQRIADIDLNAQNVLDNLNLLNVETNDRISADGNLQTQINTLADATAGTVFVQPEEPVPGVDGVPDPIPDNARWFDSDDNNKPHVYDQDNLVWISTEDPRIAQNQADISNLSVSLSGDIAANADAISVLDTTVTNLDGAVTSISQDLTTLESTVDDPSTGVAANASAVDSLQTQVSANDGEIQANATALQILGVVSPDQTAFILDTNTVRLDTDTGDTLAARFLALTAADADNAAAITSEQNARISADGALASDIAIVQTSVDGNTAAIQTNATSVNGLEAQFTVKVDVNGHVAGFGLASSPSDDTSGGQFSEFIINANRVAVIDPGNGLSAPINPFTVQDGTVFMRDVVIQSALIESIDAGLITTGVLSADRIDLDGLTLTNQGGQLAINAVPADLLGAGFLSSAITLSADAHIKAGQTAFDTGSGFFIGKSGSNWVFSFGNELTQKKITWDGSNLNIVGGRIFGGVQLLLGGGSGSSFSTSQGGPVTSNLSVTDSGFIEIGGDTIEQWVRGENPENFEFFCEAISGDIFAVDTGDSEPLEQWIGFDDIGFSSAMRWFVDSSGGNTRTVTFRLTVRDGSTFEILESGEYTVSAIST